MIRLLIALMLSALVALGQSTQETAAPSAQPASSAQSKSPEPAKAPAESSEPVFKVCGGERSSRCATPPLILESQEPQNPPEASDPKDSKAHRKKSKGTTVLL